MDWQPIETAPKDGESVLLYFPDGAPWNEGNIGIGFWAGDGSDNWYASECDSHNMTADGQRNPTHWMPLPVPPINTR